MPDDIRPDRHFERLILARSLAAVAAEIGDDLIGEGGGADALALRRDISRKIAAFFQRHQNCLLDLLRGRLAADLPGIEWPAKGRGFRA